MSGFQWAYAAAWAVAVVAIIAGAVTAASLAGADLGLSKQALSWLGVVTTVCAGLAALLPSVRTTPSIHEEHKDAVAQTTGEPET